MFVGANQHSMINDIELYNNDRKQIPIIPENMTLYLELKLRVRNWSYIVRPMSFDLSFVKMWYQIASQK